MRRVALLLTLALVSCKTASAPTNPDECADVTAFARRAAGDGALAAWRAGTPATDSTRAALETAARAFQARCARDEAEALTGALVRFATVSAQQSAADGPDFVAMRGYLEQWAKSHHFDFEATEKNGAWVVATGTGAPSVAFVMHADVVPVHEGTSTASVGLPPGWSHPPFEMTIADDKLYGRGTEDDKGPIAAVLVTLHTLQRFGVVPDGRVEAIMGTGEEHDWTGMKDFVKSRPQAPAVISLDASYPVVIGESGFVAWTLESPRATELDGKSSCVRVEHAEAGQFLTQVPGTGRLVLANGAVDAVREAAKAAHAALGDARLGFEVKQEAGKVVLTTTGEAIHSSEADHGANALWLLGATAARLDLCPGGAKDVLQTIGNHLAGDHWGERLGLAYAHEVMGRLLVIPTVLRTEADKVVLRINMRRPAGRTTAEFSAGLDATLETLKATAPGLRQAEQSGRYVGEPALVDPNSRLVTTLMDIYRAQSGDAEAKAKSIRGGTYARLFEGAVSFGPSLPGRAYRGHAPDEYLEREALDLMLRTSLEAVLRLGAPAK